MHPQGGAVAAELDVPGAFQGDEGVALAEERAFLRDHFRAAREDDLAVRAREERPRDPRGRLLVDDDLPRAGVERLLEDLR